MQQMAHVLSTLSMPLPAALPRIMRLLYWPAHVWIAPAEPLNLGRAGEELPLQGEEHFDLRQRGDAMFARVELSLAARHHLDVGPAEPSCAASDQHVVGANGGRVDLSVSDLMRPLDDDRLHRRLLYGR